MRHNVYGKHLGRNKNERQRLFDNLVNALFSHGTITTTEAKAKAIKGLVDKLINSVKAQKSSDQQVLSILPKLGSRTSGYTSMVKLGTRQGDQTMMVRMSLIGAEEIKPEKEKKVTPIKRTSKK